MKYKIKSLCLMLLFVSITASHNAFAWGDRSWSDGSSSWSDDGSSGSWGDGGEEWAAADCRSCHEDWQNLPLRASNPDNHHLLVGTTTRHTTAPNAVIGQPYDCTTCHVFTWSFEEARYVMEAERNCLNCHQLETVANQYRGNRHHDTETARSRSCSTCHARMPEGHFSFGGDSWGR